MEGMNTFVDGRLEETVSVAGSWERVNARGQRHVDGS